MVLFCMGRVLKPSGKQLKVCGDFDDTNERHLVHAPEQLTVLCWKLQTEADCTMLDSFQGISFSAPVLQVLLNHSECAGLSPGLWRAVDVSVWLWQRLGQELVLLCTQRRRSTRSAPLGPAEQETCSFRKRIKYSVGVSFCTQVSVEQCSSGQCGEICLGQFSRSLRKKLCSRELIQTVQLTWLHCLLNLSLILCGFLHGCLQAWFTSARTCCTWRKEGCPGNPSDGSVIEPLFSAASTETVLNSWDRQLPFPGKDKNCSAGSPAVSTITLNQLQNIQKIPGSRHQKELCGETQ
ncbi:uncharacterized protein LOC135281073 isoform X3 [Passer domesticus]|uniref:uncharacterized protein LOC135281073 isoform X3 n=1 Tax=Passer domesticus TaxID=48849 RepID=UPI0030FE9EE5